MTQFRLHSLQTKLLLIFFLLCLVPLISLAWIAYDESQAILKDSLGAKLAELATQGIGKIDHILSTSQMDVQNIALTEVMQDIIFDDANRRISETLIRLQASSDRYSLLLGLNTQGMIVASSNPSLIGQNFSNQIPGKDTPQSQTVFMSDLHYDSLLNTYAVTVTTAITDSETHTYTLGYLSAKLSWDAITKWMQDIHITLDSQSPTDYAILLNQRGQVIGVPAFLKSQTQHLMLQDNWLQEGSLATAQGISGQQGFVVESDREGRDVLVGYAASQGYDTFPGLGWTMLIIQDKNQAFAPVETLSNSLLRMTVVVGSLVFWLAVVVSRYISNPIRQLTAHAKGVATGQHSTLLSTQSQDEIGDLTDAFNQMTRDLQLSTTALLNAREEHIIQSMADSLILLNPDGSIRTVNGATLEMLGYEKDYLVGKSITSILDISPDESEDKEVNNDGLLKDGKRELTYRRKDGTAIPVMVSKAALRDQHGNSDGFVWVASDISERMLIETRLRDAKRKAEEVGQMKSNFLATMSHEIRTPMNGVIGMTGLLLESDLAPNQRQMAKTVKSSGEALLNIINDILDFSKIESGKLEFETIDFDLRNAVEESLELFAEKAGNKQLELVALFSADVPTALRGDPGRLRQILVNLIGNAIKFTMEGEVTVQIQRVDETLTNIQLRFLVRDTGIGIAPEAQDNLFQAFTQADSSTTRQFGGTGLGLAICRQLVELMNGEIGVESVLDQGTKFWFTVNFQKQPLILSEVTPLARLEGVRICCVDDNATNRELLLQHTKSWGMDALIVETPIEALQQLRQAASIGKPFDIAILDMEMPEMDGSQLAKTITADATIGSIPLVLLTSLGRRGDSKVAKDAGFKAYLTKPLRKAQLHDCLLMVLGLNAGEPSRSFSPSLVTKYTLTEMRRRTCARILVAEDHMVNQQLAVMMLEKLGYRADVVANGKEVIDAISRISYDLILMDCQMPEMDGYTAAQIIRQSDEDTQQIPIIAMTANAMSGDREKCLAAGMSDYLTKPVNLQQLQEVLQQWLPSSKELDQSGNADELNTSAMCKDNEKPETTRDLTPIPVLNRTVIQQIRDLAGENYNGILTRVIEQFVHDAQVCVTAIQKAIDHDQPNAIVEAAHGLKGISRNMGAEQLATLCFQIEQNGKSQTREEAKDQILALQQELARVNQALQVEATHPT